MTLNGFYVFENLPEKHNRRRPIGSLLIACKPHLETKLITSNKNHIILNTLIGTIILTYYNRDTDLSTILFNLTDCLNIIDSNSKHVLITGDFNCRVDLSNHKGDGLIEFLSNHGFLLLNNTANLTYFDHRGGTCIDLVFQRAHPPPTNQE